MKIKTCKLRAADEFRAKGDVRNYLNGIHINKDFVEATNGHVAIQMRSETKTNLDVIVRFKGKIPKSAQDTELEFNKGKNIAYHYDINGTLVDVQMFYIEDGIFPDFKKFLPSKLSLGEKFPMLSAEYMAIAHKAFGSQKNKFIGMEVVHYTDENGLVVYRPKTTYLVDHGGPLIAIMPMKK